VGILYQPVLKTKGNLNLPVPSVRMAKLFYEFLGRYNEWKIAKLQEAIELFFLLFLGLCIVFLPWFLPGRGLIISMVILVFFYFATRHYLIINERANHLYVNVYILHHHLVGKLEVGFCDHSESCYCVENFRRYVAKKYRISLYNRSLR
jgi:hypothetical protein